MNKLPAYFRKILKNYSFWANVEYTLPKVTLPRYEFVEYQNDGKTMLVRMH